MLLVTFSATLSKVMMLLAYVLAIWACVRVPRGRWVLLPVLCFTIVLALLVDTTGSISGFLRIRNTVIYNWFATIEFVALLYLFHLFRPAWKWKLIVGGVVGVAAMGIAAWIDRERSFLLIEGLLVVYLILNVTLMASLWHLASTSDRPLHRVPEFWLFMAMLFFYGGITPMLGVIRFILENDAPLANRLWRFVPVLIVLRYTLTAYACRLAAARPSGNGR